MEETTVSNEAADIIGLTVQGFPSLVACARHVVSEIGAGEAGRRSPLRGEGCIVFGGCSVGRLLDEATLRYPDGAGVVLAMRRRGIATARIPA